jgi:hypothetical protein
VRKRSAPRHKERGVFFWREPGVTFLLRSPTCSIVSLMADDPSPLSPADPDDVCRALAFALTFDGRKRFRHADELAAKITA